MAIIRTTADFDAWFSALRDRVAKARISIRVQRLSDGNPGQHRVLKSGVRELKVDHGPGYRVYYVERAGVTYILLCGGDKSTQKTDIQTAERLAHGV